MDDQRIERRQEAVMHKSQRDMGRGGAGVKLSDMVPEARFVACSEIVVGECYDDPLLCGPGDVFVAREGVFGEANEAAQEALANGAAAIIAETVIPTGGVPLAIVPNADWAYARLSHALAGDPAQRLRVIAVTGTSGKTTTVWLTATVLAEAGLRVGVISDLGCLDGSGMGVEQGHVEDPAGLAAWLERLADSGCTHAVVEVSSRMLAACALAGMECDTVVVTNLADAHRDLHGSLEAYHAIKERILDSLADDGCLIVNGDDERLCRFIDRCATERPAVGTITVGLQTGDLTATPVERSLFGQTFLMHAGSHTVPVAVTPPVVSFVRDALLAAAVGVRTQVPLERIARGLEAAGSVSGRVERLDRGQDFAAFLDLPTSGHALASTLASLRRLTPGRLLLIAEEGIANTLGGARRFVTRSAKWCDDCLIAPADIAAEYADDRIVASYARIDRALAGLGAGDCVLVLGDLLRGGGPAGDPESSQLGLIDVVDGWLQLAHPPRQPAQRRAA
jgi:UDP-N-acetylmuramoyl-L-alanyl-D-glutamate--2,6-diaminopimelate ligase